MGIYLTLGDLRKGIMCGAYGPDEMINWVTITDDGQLLEIPMENPNNPPPVTIAAIYYMA